MPTMGGIFVLMTVLVTCLCWADLFNPLIWIFLLCLFGFGAIGFWDDWAKIKVNRGISARGQIPGPMGSSGCGNYFMGLCRPC